MLNPLKPGLWEFEDKVFLFRPFYVGRGVDDRKNNHTLPSKLRAQSHKNATILKIQKFGMKPIIEEVFSGLDYNTSENIEIKMIKHFGRRDLGAGVLTNLTDGGLIPRNCIKKGKRGFRSDSKRVDQFDLDGNFLRKWDWAVDAARELGVRAEGIRECCRKQNRITYSGFIWRYDGTSPAPSKPEFGLQSKEVFQYKNGFYCQSFLSIREASRTTGIRWDKISNCCHRSQKTAGGFQWFFEFQGDVLEDEPKVLKKGDRRRLFKLDKHLNVVKDYNSMAEATTELNVDRIRKSSLNDQTKIFKGFYWCYADDFKLKYPELMSKYEQKLKLSFPIAA
jgi:hypothetical protein